MKNHNLMIVSNLKIKKMKNIIASLILIISITSCKAQVIAVENYNTYNKELEDNAYIKDINNVLSKFIGIWKGTYNSNNYEFKLVKNTKNFKTRPSIKKDELLLRYKITNSNGIVIENTLNLPNNSAYVMQNGYVAETGSYVFSYIGKEVACGQNGWVFIRVLNNTNNQKAKLFLQVEREKYPECTTGTAQQILPTNWIDLTKQ